MSEYIVDGAEPNETVLHHVTSSGYDGWSWLPVKEEITRCRDCRRYHPKEGEMFSCRFEYNGFVQWRSAEPDGFCAWGEPREES